VVRDSCSKRCWVRTVSVSVVLGLVEVEEPVAAAGAVAVVGGSL
jgi:hypothetical protein